MTTPDPSYAAYAAQLKAFDEELFLGQLCWYSIPEDVRVDHGAMCRALLEAGLNGCLPPSVRSVDVFKRACTAAQRKNVPGDDPAVRFNYLIREVGKDLDNVWRRLVEERVDTEGRTLGYTEIYELRFERNPQIVSHRPLVSVPDAAATAIVNEVQRNFAAWNNVLTPHAIREVVRRHLTQMNSTVVRPSGGVYFVRESHARSLQALEQVINDICGPSSFHTLPLVDNSKQRALLKQAFEAESIDEIDRLLGEVRQITLKGSTITADRFAEFKLQTDHLRKKVLDYSDLLDTALENTATRLEIMDEALFELVGRVKVKA